MTSAPPRVEPQHIARPVLRDGWLRCPRCDAGLQFDRQEFVCLICGYEYLPEREELEELEAYRRRLRPRQLAAGVAVVAFSLEGVAIGAALVALALLATPLVRRLAGR